MNDIRIYTDAGFYDIPATALKDQQKYNGGSIVKIEDLSKSDKVQGHVYDKFTLQELKDEALKMELPKQKWQRMGEKKLRNYLKEQA